jgi:hypothetical protein
VTRKIQVKLRKESNIKINAVDMYAGNKVSVVIATELMALKMNATNFANGGCNTHPHYNLRQMIFLLY